MIKKCKKVIVGMSGGVDSSVSALLLKQQGFDVIGVFMKNWSGQSLGLKGETAAKWEKQCPWKNDVEDVRKVCAVIDIPYYVMNFEKEYKDKVLNYFFKEFRAGRTPNPDVMCNKEIKFKAFLHKARKLEADYIATGHYAKRVQKNNHFEIHTPKDTNKDQTYFLYTTTQQQLEHVLFPLADLTKKQVRVFAKKYKLPNHSKPDSQGICFVGEVDIKKFLSLKIRKKPGDIITTQGEKLGRHEGLSFYTIGQREGLGIGGPGLPLYVVDKNVEKNELIVARGSHHKSLFSKKLIASQMHWISGVEPKYPLHCEAKIRYRQQTEVVSIQKNGKDYTTLIASFKNPQRAITPGQSIVLYQGSQMLGGGIIESKI